ncbi:hypothetical protein OKW30_006061 [Paraburkholderia sp. Clong3]
MSVREPEQTFECPVAPSDERQELAEFCLTSPTTPHNTTNEHAKGILVLERPFELPLITSYPG